jgi:putative transposase
MAAPTGRPAKDLMVSAADRRQLELMARSPSMPSTVVQRAKMILALANVASNSAVARNFRGSWPTGSLWGSRYRECGLGGLHNELMQSRPDSTSDEQIVILIDTTPRSRSKGRAHWTCGSLAAEIGLTETTVRRTLTLFGVRGHRTPSFKPSPYPFFIEQLRDIVGL